MWLIPIILTIWCASLTFSTDLRLACYTLTLLSFVGLIYEIIYQLGKLLPSIYRFVHQYKEADIGNATTHIAKLSNEVITQLEKKYGKKELYKDFRRNPIKIDDISTYKYAGWRHVKVLGWVYATNEKEAQTIINNQKFGDSEMNTPEFFR